jgi:hypothetical protein
MSRARTGNTVNIPRVVFTPKEVAALEQCFPDSTSLPRKMGIAKADLEEFRKLYRYWPSYSETLA